MEENQRHRGSLAPIFALPPEVLGVIFTFTCARRDQDGGSTPQPVNHLPICMILSHVCAGWRTVALESTNLWNPIHLSNLSTRAFLEYMLEKRQGLPISVVFNVAKPTTPNTILNPDVFRTIFSNTQRLQSFDLTLPNYTIGQILEQTNGILDGMKRLKITNGPPGSVHYPAANLPIKIPLLGGPNLERLEIKDYRLPWDSQLLRYPRLTHLKLNAIPSMDAENGPALFDFLRQSPRLVSLDLEYPFLLRTGEYSATVRIPLPNLKILKLSFLGHRVGLINLLRSLLLPPPPTMSEISISGTLNGHTEPEVAQALISSWTNAHQDPNVIYPRAFTIAQSKGRDPLYHVPTANFYVEAWASSLPDPLWPFREHYEAFRLSRPYPELSFRLAQIGIPFTFPLYQGPWSFEVLRLIEVYGKVSPSFWTMLGNLPLLETVHTLNSELGDLITALQGSITTVQTSTPVPTSPLSLSTRSFPTLRTLVIRRLAAVDARKTFEKLIEAFGDRLPLSTEEYGEILLDLETLCIRPAVPDEPLTLRPEMCSGGLARHVLWERNASVLTLTLLLFRSESAITQTI